MTTVKVGDVVAWADVPDGALVRRAVDDGGFLYLRRSEEGWCVGKMQDDGEHYFEALPANLWAWRHKARQAASVTIVALGLTGRETADDLRRLAEVFEIRALLWEDACDQTWCVCIGQRDGEHYMLLDGWTDETANLTDEQALTLTAERLHAVGWRSGMTAEDADRLLAAEEAR